LSLPAAGFVGDTVSGRVVKITWDTIFLIWEARAKALGKFKNSSI
jgi:hypothetical protein